RNLRFLAPIESLRERTDEEGKRWMGVELHDRVDGGSRGDPVRIEFARSCVYRFDEAVAVAPGDAPSTGSSSRSGWALLAGLSLRVERRVAATLLVVDPNGRLSLPGLYVAGDARGAEVLVCESFDGSDSADYERVPRTVSVELAAAEAVVAVEAIARTLGAAPVVDPPAPRSRERRADPAQRWRLVGLNTDGSLGEVHPIACEVMEIGRCGRDLAEPDDEHMADHHASLVCEAGEYYIADSGRGSGVWVRIEGPEGVLIEDEDQIWLGAQILVASHKGDTWTLVHYGPDGQPRETHAVGPEGLVAGRGATLDLDPDDPLLSRRHLE
ncbi:MAG: hypothetical protein GY733_06615, partial [bacterium]|nr:hypothetical protein [bacterium]